MASLDDTIIGCPSAPGPGRSIDILGLSEILPLRTSPEAPPTQLEATQTLGTQVVDNRIPPPPWEPDEFENIPTLAFPHPKESHTGSWETPTSFSPRITGSLHSRIPKIPPPKQNISPLLSSAFPGWKSDLSCREHTSNLLE